MSEEDELVLHKLREELDGSERLNGLLYDEISTRHERMMELQGRYALLETRLRESAGKEPLPFLGCAITMVITVAICWWLL